MFGMRAFPSRILLLPGLALATLPSAAEDVDLRATFPHISPYTKPPSPMVIKDFSLPGPGTVKVVLILAPWFRTGTPLVYRSLVPVDGRDEGAWTEHFPGVDYLKSSSIPERWVDGSGLTITSEYRVNKARPRLQVALAPSTVRFGDGSVEQLANSVQVSIQFYPEGASAAEPAALTFPVGQTWNVVERSGNDTWTAVWHVRADGKSFDATWRHTPGNETGELPNFAHIASISGNTIVIDRPGVGRYTGTLSADRLHIQGKGDWPPHASWEVSIQPKGSRTVSLGRAWRETENGWTGHWTRRGTSNVFDATWTKPGEDSVAAVLEMSLEADGTVKIHRKDTRARVAFEIDYTGKIDGTGHVEGSATIRGNGYTFGWSAQVD